VDIGLPQFDLLYAKQAKFFISLDMTTTNINSLVLKKELNSMYRMNGIYI
jgi:hypothetical protein